MSLDYKSAREMLDKEFSTAEGIALKNEAPGLKQREIVEQFDKVFSSNTWAYREVLLGCVLAKIQDPSIDVHKPYKGHGENSYNGRTLDEKVINPFLKDNRIPSTKGPFLSKFRRSVGFDASTKTGTRDVKSFEAFVAIVDRVNKTKAAGLAEYLRFTNSFRSGRRPRSRSLVYSESAWSSIESSSVACCKRQAEGGFPSF